MRTAFSDSGNGRQKNMRPAFWVVKIFEARTDMCLPAIAVESLSLPFNALQDRAIAAAHGGVFIVVHFRVNDLVKA